MNLIKYPKLELKITELLEVGGLTGLVRLVRRGGLERANKGKRFSRNAKGRRVGRAGWVKKAKKKKQICYY